MKPNSLYAQLELIPDPVARSGRSDYDIGRVWAGAKTCLGPMVSSLVAYLCGSNSLSVTVKRDRQGQTAFVVYDPVSRQRHTFGSEQELRVWVDQRYYQ